MLISTIPRIVPKLPELLKQPNRVIKHVCKMCLSTNSTPLSVLQLQQRGVFENVFPNTRLPELQRLLETPQTMYCGFDPTSDSLHIGNLISITALIHAQRAGHSPIAVIGGATAYIGDPSGKVKDREAMTAQQVESNVMAIMAKVKAIVDNHREHFTTQHGEGMPEFRILNNNDWYKDVNVIDFLSSVGRHFRLGEMISRQSVQSRLNSKEGISCTEFMYQVFQAADWLHLYQNYGCSIQLGGNDQLGNITSGFDLIHKVTNKFVFGLVTPLLLAPGGEKLGKSTGNSVWLNSDKTSAYEFYQHFINLPDSEVDKYLKLFTFYSNEEIEHIVQQHQKEPEKRLGQHRLADSITTLVHGASGLASAQTCTQMFFHNSMSALESMSESEMTQMSKNIPTVEIALDPSMTVFGLATVLNAFKTNADAERVIKAGGLYINQSRVNDPSHRIGDGSHILANNLSLVRVGKKTYYLVKWRVL